VFSLGGRVGLVTGASRGIGRAIALELGGAGAAVGVHYHTREADARQVVEAIRRGGAESRAFGADVADPDSVRKLVGAVTGWKGRLDFVVTNAGVYRGPSLEEVSEEDWRSALGTNLLGAFWTVRAALPALQRSDRGAAVLVSSIIGRRAALGGIPYQASKAAIEQMTRGLAIELAPRIRVNAVAPGFIRTDMNRDAHADPVFAKQVVGATPLARWGEPEDIAPAVRFLLSDEASWITGTVLPVDGGIEWG
jgi:3-oxoacyl-[acyl-carrier protein] reductase